MHWATWCKQSITRLKRCNRPRQASRVCSPGRIPTHEIGAGSTSRDLALFSCVLDHTSERLSWRPIMTNSFGLTMVPTHRQIRQRSSYSTMLHYIRHPSYQPVLRRPMVKLRPQCRIGQSSCRRTPRLHPNLLCPRCPSAARCNPRRPHPNLRGPLCQLAPLPVRQQHR